MSAVVVERIFKEFKFRTLSKTSSKNQIYKSIMNTAFKCNIINSFMDDGEHIAYCINGDLEPYLEPLQKLCKDYARGQGVVAFVADDEPLQCEEVVEEKTYVNAKKVVKGPIEDYFIKSGDLAVL